MKNPKNILITGASGGLGGAIALAYAQPGITLYLQGRNHVRLDDIASRARNQGAQVFTKLIEVTDREAMEKWLQIVDNFAPLDLVIANAGISAGTGDKGESEAQVRKVFDTNVNGVMNTIQPIIPMMVARKKGQIAIMSSLAGIRPLPSSPAYSASKACVRYYGEALRGWLKRSNVEVNVICPGYITTAMTAKNNFPMPFIMKPEKAASVIVAGLACNRSRIAFPRTLYWPLWWLTCLPPALTDPFFAMLPTKQNAD